MIPYVCLLWCSYWSPNTPIVLFSAASGEWSCGKSMWWGTDWFKLERRTGRNVQCYHGHYNICLDFQSQKTAAECLHEILLKGESPWVAEKLISNFEMERLMWSNLQHLRSWSIIIHGHVFGAQLSFACAYYGQIIYQPEVVLEQSQHGWVPPPSDGYHPTSAGPGTCLSSQL